LFFKEKDSKRDQDFFYGVNQLVHRKNNLNLNEENFKIAIINDEYRLKIYKNLYDEIADKIMRRGVALFREGFKRVFFKPAPIGIVNYFKHKVAIASHKKIELYSIEHFRSVAADVMKEHLFKLHPAVLQKIDFLHRSAK
jgi:hypothetical protein